MFRSFSQWDNPFMSLVAVAVVLAASLVGTGVMVKSYREGAVAKAPLDKTCTIVCSQVTARGQG